MALKKSLMIAAAVSSIGLGAAAVTANTASATANGTGLVEKIAQKFNLDKAEVQKVFDEERTVHEAERKAHMEDRLSQAVTDGKLTEDQKAKILAKLEEFKADHPTREEMESKTPEQHKAEMEQKHAELKKWAEENNIPEEYLPLRMKFTIRGGPDGPERGATLQMHTD